MDEEDDQPPDPNPDETQNLLNQLEPEIVTKGLTDEQMVSLERREQDRKDPP